MIEKYELVVFSLLKVACSVLIGVVVLNSIVEIARETCFELSLLVCFDGTVVEKVRSGLE